MAIEDIGPAAQRFLDPRAPFDLNHNLAMLRVEGAGKPLAEPEAIREQILDRIHFMPHLRQRLIVPPARLGPPFLVDDPNFDIDYHLIVIRGEQISDARLHQIVGAIMQRPLARFRPLWEVQLIYGLDGGGMALVIKGHHLILDGLMAWQGITATLVDLAPEGVEIDRAEWAPPPLPTKGEAARHAVAHRAQTVRKRASSMGTSAKDPEQRRRELDTLRAVPQTIRDEVAPRAPRLPINGPIGIRREVSWVALPLPEIKAAAAASAEHVTVNDVVLALVSEGLRELLLSTGLSHPLPSPRVNIPISVARRTQGRVSFDERDAYMVIDMDLAERDLAKRLVAIRECTEIRKTREATVIEEMLDVVFMLPNRERERAWRVLASARVFNAVLSNIQGIQQDLWFRGHPISTIVALGSLPDDHGIRLVALSAQNVLTIGITHSIELILDIGPFVRGVREGLARLAPAQASRSQ